MNKLGSFVLVLGSLVAASLQATIIQPTGNYVMQAVHNQNVKDGVIAATTLTGFHLRDSWSLFEPQKGVFNYAWYDQQLARAARLNKHVTFGLYAGAQSDPSWGNSPDEFVKAVAALGTRYGNNPLIDAVHMAAPQVTDHSMEMYVPSSWHGSDQQAITIWKQSIDTYNKAFPTKPLVLDLAMAPDSRGAITKVVDEYARATLAERLNVIVCNLKASTSLTAPHFQELMRLRGEGVRVGFEMVSPSTDTSRFGGPFSQAMAIGNSHGGSWYQIYQADVPNLRLVSAGGIPEAPALISASIAIFILLLVPQRNRRKLV